MNQRTKFEDRLLDELKSVVAAREAERQATRQARRFGWKPRLALTAGLVGVLGLAFALPIVGGQSRNVQSHDVQPAAWTVEPRKNDLVWVEVRRPEDPQGLERELEKYVPNVSVNMPPSGKMCEPGWYESAGPRTLKARASGRALDGKPHDAAVASGFLATELSDDTTLVVYYHPSAHLPEFLDIAKGRVDHCPLVPDDE